MTYASQPGIDLINAYLLDLTEAYPDGEDAGTAGQLKLCLRIFRQALKTHARNERVRLEWLQHYKTGSRLAHTLLESLLVDEAKAFVGWSPGDAIQNGQQKLSLVLGWMIAEMEMLIHLQEERYPEHRTNFALERATYKR